VTRSDLPALFAFQLDPESNRMAVTNARDRESFDGLWERIFADERVVARAIVVGDELVGSISIFQSDGHDSVGYWVAREWWGKGIASRALELLLLESPKRPLHARVARSNAASIRVLERCGFVCTGSRHFPGDDRFPACDESLYILE